MEAQTIIKKGIDCRIGNGQSVNIVEDPWLPLEGHAYVHTRNDSIYGQKVSSLMNPDSNTWDTNLILDFSTEEIQTSFSLFLWTKR